MKTGDKNRRFFVDQVSLEISKRKSFQPRETFSASHPDTAYPRPNRHVLFVEKHPFWDVGAVRKPDNEPLLVVLLASSFGGVIVPVV